MPFNALRRRNALKRPRLHKRLRHTRKPQQQSVYSRTRVATLYKPITQRAFENVMHIYNYRAVLSSSASPGFVGATESFRLNTLSEPRINGASYTPSGYAEQLDRYTKYCVRFVDVIVTGNVPGSTSEAYLAVAFNSSGMQTSFSSTTTSEMEQMGNVGFAKLSPYGDRQCTVRRRIYINQIEGVPAMTPVVNSDFWGDASAVPGIIPFIEVGTASANVTATSIDMTVNVQLVFYTKWFNRSLSYKH